MIYFHTQGNRQTLANALMVSGIVLTEEGLAELRQSLRISREPGSRYEIAGGLLRLPETEQNLGRSARAVRLYCAARNVHESVGSLQPDDDLRFVEYLTSCRTALGETEFEAALGEGRAMTMEQAVEYAVELSGGMISP